MKTKTINHSRGPWAVGIETDDNEAQIISADGQHLATVEQYPLEANAHLIASAPELYEALKRLTEEAAKGLDQGATDDGIWNCKRLADARHALAHAEGRELGCN